MAMFDTETLKRLRYLSLITRRAAERSLVTTVRRKLPGGGTEATGLRDYTPGDDYRYIDWHWCARRDELLTKTFEGEADRHVYILLDCSPSMGLGQPPKFDLARQIAAMLGYAVLANLGCLSVGVFSDGLVTQQPPIRHRSHSVRLLRFLEGLSLQGDRTNLARTAEQFARRYQRHGPVVVISDLYDREGFRPALDTLRHRGYEPRVVQIYGLCEACPGLLGDVELYDVESGFARRATVTERAARRYEERFVEFQESVRRYSATHGIRCLQFASDTPENDVLLTVLGAKSPLKTSS
ncbi:MAG: DUF58 domain-containing protein [Pirellulales bacterium]|nr:DUF58 domain-containing protein [Pirellulales bacterium]